MKSPLPAKQTPLVSVIIPAYNAERFIARTLSSVLKQTYQNLEIIIVDDGSNDGTAEIIQQYQKIDNRLILLQQANAGVAAARNLAICHAKGELIAPLDADDIWYPQNIEKQVQCMMAASARVGLVYAWSVDLDKEDALVGRVQASRIEGQVYTTLLLHDFIANASSVLMRRCCLDKVGDYDSSLKANCGQGGEDWEIYLRIAEDYEFKVVPEFLIGYRKLPDSMSKDCDQMAKSRQLIWQAIRKKYPNAPTALERLSNGSFYLYLADQCCKSGQHDKVLYWLSQALRSDPLTPWLRFGTYRLLMSSVLPKFHVAIAHHKEQSISMRTIITDQQSSLNIKVLAESVLHQLAPAVFGTPYEWKRN
ncbi:MAG: glycosyl transferase family 2 [Leptolyngbya foveolarum]|uniref:Glycosyl transferase family 2 n=1 Tax=Leptolyngbya foveolarum TaxID=47253 RepID=A0A2W4U136_9CYAN|nr:MAG: glycosyl transferase family 2 [Leptolyngbya foveolarum]